MAVKVITGFEFVDASFAIPTGFGDKKKFWSPRFGVAGATVEEIRSKASTFADALKTFTRADLSGRSYSDGRFIEDIETRPADLRVTETLLKVIVKNQNAKAVGSMILPPVRDDMDIKAGSADMQALATAIKANCSLLVKGDSNNLDVPVPIDWVKITPITYEQQAAPANVSGIDSTDNRLERVEQLPAVA